jgi:3-dehydroquinate synthetase
MSEHAPIVVDPALANIYVKCPVEGQEHQPAQLLGKFMQTEEGQKFGSVALKNVEFLVESGIDLEKAAVIAFGGAIVTDEAGQIARAPASQPEEVPIQLQTFDSKKK